MKTALIRALLVTGIVFLVVAAMQSCTGMTAAQTGTAVSAGAVATGTFLTGLVDVMAPFLPPEKVAELTTIIHSGQDTLAAMAKATAVYADQISQVKANAMTPGSTALTAGTIDAGIEGAFLAVPAIKAIAGGGNSTPPPAAKA